MAWGPDEGWFSNHHRGNKSCHGSFVLATLAWKAPGFAGGGATSTAGPRAVSLLQWGQEPPEGGGVTVQSLGPRSSAFLIRSRGSILEICAPVHAVLLFNRPQVPAGHGVKLPSTSAPLAACPHPLHAHPALLAGS